MLPQQPVLQTPKVLQGCWVEALPGSARGAPLRPAALLGKLLQVGGFTESAAISWLLSWCGRAAFAPPATRAPRALAPCPAPCDVPGCWDHAPGTLPPVLVPRRQNKLNFGRSCALSEEGLGDFANWSVKLERIYHISPWSPAESVRWKQLLCVAEQLETGKQSSPKPNGEQYRQRLFHGRER